MTIRVALHHQTRYAFDRLVGLSPHEVRLRPAPHCRTPIHSYSLRVEPEKHFINWQQDAYGNYIARLVFPEKAAALTVTVDLVADMTVINPFDFFVEHWAERFPFDYPAQLATELAPYREKEPVGSLLVKWLEDFRRHGFKPGTNTVDFLVALNQRVQSQVKYLVRMEPGIQTPDETLQRAAGSCRDSGWLLVQILRHLGLAARFVSGYLVQLVADVKPLDGPAGTTTDFTDLHAWAEAYVPGAGWIGLDPTSGLLAGEGHIPLAATAFPTSAAPITGFTDPCESTLEFEMKVMRIHEDPRVTRPYSEAQWTEIDALGRAVDRELDAAGVRLTHGGEPTFVSIDDMEGAEWNYTALAPRKWELAERLAWRLKERFAPGGLLFYGQGKWYPGEPLPRWALGLHWRRDGRPLWRNAAMIAGEGSASGATLEHAQAFAVALARELDLDASLVIAAFEDPILLLEIEAGLPLNVDPANAPLKDYDDRARLRRIVERGADKPAGYVLPLRAPAPGAAARSATSAVSPSTWNSAWESSPWPLRRERLFLLAGDSPLGYRLPLASLPERLPEEIEPEFARDTFDPRDDLHDAHLRTEKKRHERATRGVSPREVVRTALCVEARDGRLNVFVPPVTHIEDFVNLVAAIEHVAEALGQPVRVEGYPPPRDPRIRTLAITPDPGVIEVNIHPASSWNELAANTAALYEEARLARLSSEKFMIDGRHTGTGGGNHVTLGGPTAADSPFLRRPDLLRSLITYWQNHPALSYLFAGLFVGPTSQAPRVDEARDDNLYELEIAFQQMDSSLAPGTDADFPWFVDRLLRHLLVDLSGNTHRAEFSIDKLYSPDGPTGRLGLVELRAFEMPPHAQMSLAQALLVRTLVARFWKEPYRGRLVQWGTQLHDRWMLPHFVQQDIHDVAIDLRAAGYAFKDEWFAPFLEFRFPRYGAVTYAGVTLELRQAIEPWHVLGEEVSGTGTARYVDSSVERLQAKVSGMTGERHVVTCNGRVVPLAPTGVHGEFVAGVRFKAWKPPSALHPTIGVHTPLVFDVVDTWSGRALGGCTYHVAHPGGRNYATFPVNANEAEARRFARFWDHGHTPGPMTVRPEPPNRSFPCTLDLRYARRD
ncbi:MAG TPA: transglutaminase family protein [Burkholderiales bacterium]|nr:transglutaminase family protein [Burkholderiales bacterium]